MSEIVKVALFLFALIFMCGSLWGLYHLMFSKNNKGYALYAIAAIIGYISAIVFGIAAIY